MNNQLNIFFEQYREEFYAPVKIMWANRLEANRKSKESCEMISILIKSEETMYDDLSISEEQNQKNLEADMMAVEYQPEGREYYWKTDFTGTFIEIEGEDWNPTCWKGTQEKYDQIWTDHLSKREDIFKWIGSHKYDTIDEYKAVWPAHYALRLNKK